MRSERITMAQAVANAERDSFRLTSPARVAPKQSRESRPRDPAAQRARKAAGKAGERIVEKLHEICFVAGVARVAKVATEMRILGTLGPGLFKCCYAKKSGVDYRGVMLDGTARGVFVEVKNHGADDERFPISRVPEVQRDQLTMAMQAGCVAVLVIIRAGHVYALPWSIARQHVSLGDAELRDWFVPAGTAYLARWAE